MDLGFKPDNGLEIDLFQFSRYMLQSTYYFCFDFKKSCIIGNIVYVANMAV